MKLAPALKTRRRHCWIESFIEATEGIPAPELFRKWTAISQVAGALERRVWVETAMSPVYPNLYILLVSPPGVGKTEAVKLADRLAHSTKKLKVAPEDVTKASLVDHLAAAHETFVAGPDAMIEYHSMHIFADELGVFFQSYDTSFMSNMTKLYDNRDRYRESRRGRGADKDLIISNPQVNLLAGTQPDFLSSFLPPEAWGQGFMSRMLMVYAGKGPRPQLFGKRTRLDTTDLLHDLKIMTEMYGEMDFTEDAANSLDAWYNQGMPPIPGHTKLQHYLPRRILHILKLCTVSAASRGNALVIELEDFHRARDWLLEVEALMPEVFKALSGVNDVQLIKELHWHLWDLYSKNGQKPIHKSRIDLFLMRAPSYSRESIFKTALSAKIILPGAGIDMFIPGNQNELRFE